MQTTIYGLDITSAPSRSKPITCAVGALMTQYLPVAKRERGTSPASEPIMHSQFPSLQVADIKTFTSLKDVQELLNTTDKTPSANHANYVAGMDFPFGLPQEFVKEAGWPDKWEDYVRYAASLSKEEFSQSIYDYMELRPKGHKLCFRATDRLARAQSPIRLNYVPVGKMFFALAPIIEASGACIPPVRMAQDARHPHNTILETYPALIARLINGKTPYKDGKASQHAERREARKKILIMLPSVCSNQLGFTLCLHEEKNLRDRILDDWKGDTMDALLCAIQAAHACLRPNFGIPLAVDRRAPEQSHLKGKKAETDGAITQIPASALEEGWILGCHMLQNGQAPKKRTGRKATTLSGLSQPQQQTSQERKK